MKYQRPRAHDISTGWIEPLIYRNIPRYYLPFSSFFGELGRFGSRVGEVRVMIIVTSSNQRIVIFLVTSRALF